MSTTSAPTKPTSGSSKSTRIARSAASAEPAEVAAIKPKRPSTLKRATRTLREKLLSKKATATRTSISEESADTEGMEPSPTTVEEKVAAWPLPEPEEAAPKRLVSDDESSGSESFAFDSHPMADQSMIIMSTCRTGVEMNMANRAANDMLQKGKEALENAGNMKRECKLIAIECLQSLYETVLSLSDSRSRHMLNCEKERSRHAQELVRVERACNRKITDLSETFAKELSLARQDVTANLAETKAIKGWLEFETRDPHRQIAELTTAMQRLEKSKEDLAERLTLRSDDRPSEADTSVQTSMLVRLESLSRQMDEHRRDLSNLSENTTLIQLSNARAVEILESSATPPETTPHTPPAKDELDQELKEIKATLTHIQKKIEEKEPTSGLPAVTTNDLTDHLQPLNERLKAVSSEMRSIRELREKTPPPPAVNLGAELAFAEMAAQPKPKPTYAQKLRQKPPPKPNHTLIVSSTDPQKTGDNVIEAIRVSMDAKRTGVRVDRVRKARNQKVILSCGTPEDLALLHTQMKTNKTLKVEKARASNPLVRIRDVLSYHTDAELVEHIKAQNKHLLQDVPVADSTLKVRYRKKARNPHECHPVLEVSPALYKRLMETEKIYIGLQRRPVEDQSPLVQCTKCLGFGHTKAVCREQEEACSFCGETHCWEKCPSRLAGKPPACKNCRLASKEAKQTGATPTLAPPHVAFSYECPEKQKWDAIARSRVAYC